MRRWIFLLLLAGLVARGEAQLGAELVERHRQRAGGRAEALRSLRWEGRTFIAGTMVPFLILAERPDRLRVESFTPERRVVQVSDGQAAPWIAHSEVRGGEPQDMGEADAADFRADADFDGPLLGFVRRGYSVDYAGEDRVEGRPAKKLLVMNRSDEIAFLWLDAETLEVVKRLIYRSRGDKRVAIETIYGDFRPVDGVPQPHRIETRADGVPLYVMIVDRVTANVALPAGTFARP